jgi:hypothetical protein
MMASVADCTLSSLASRPGSSANDDVKADIQEIKKMLKSRSEATRQASKISVDDLEAVLVSLKCTVLSIEHEDVGVIEDVEYTWAENKYEPQQQEEYLQALKAEVSSCPVTVIISSCGSNANEWLHES